MNRHTFYLYLRHSPIIERVARGFYALRGATWDPAELADLIESSQTRREPGVEDSGRTKDGAVWLGCAVTENMLHLGVVRVDSAVRKITGARRFELLTVDGRAVGTFVIGQGRNASGLGPYMDRRGVEAGDAIVITLDAELDCAVVQSGSMELLEDYADGAGWGPERFLDVATSPSLA